MADDRKQMVGRVRSYFNSPPPTRQGQRFVQHPISVSCHPKEPSNTKKTYLCKSAEISDNHRIFLHLLADGEIIKGLDGPVHYGAPDTNQWKIGECLIEKRGIYIPPEANAGTYDLIAGVYSFGDEGPNPYETLMQITVLTSGIDNSQR